MAIITRRRAGAVARNLIGAALISKWSGAARAETLPDLSGLKLINPPSPAPVVVFRDASGADAPLSAHRGKGVVLNFWATWCPPCVSELPSLDRLAASLKGSGIQVLAVSEDLGAKAARVVRAFYAAHGIDHLPVLTDPFGKASDAFANEGVPTTWLIDAQGRVKARLEGGADWNTPAALARIKALIG